MTDLPYTDTDLRAEAARQHANLLDEALDFAGVGESLFDAPVASRRQDDGLSSTWDEIVQDDEAGEVQEKVHALIRGAADVSEWAVNLGAAGLTQTISMGWYVTGSGWDLAVQIAHLPQIKPEVRDEIESAVRLAVERVFAEHGLVPRGLDTTA